MRGRCAHIDWKQERLRIPERKADHSAVYLLSTVRSRDRSPAKSTASFKLE